MILTEEMKKKSPTNNRGRIERNKFVKRRTN